MSRRRKLTDTTPFDTLRLEGSLFVPELLERASRGEATFQKETDYHIPRGLKLHDEYGRAYRIATALWQSFAPQIQRTDVDASVSTRAFVTDVLRDCLGYSDLTVLNAPVQIGDRGFPITAQAFGGRLPIIIAPHTHGLDDPDTHFAIHGSGSRKKSAHQLAQEFLNASRDALWAIVTNGRTLRLLRDADTLTRPNFLEFDIETILREGEDRYSDFSALWRILHASRAGASDVAPIECTWEKWKAEGHAQGVRVREGLRVGVQEALIILGRGFLAHPDNAALRQNLHDGSLATDAYFQQLLRLIYRCLFLFCAEERDLIHPPDSPLPSREAYSTGYSLRRLRKRSLRHTAHDQHGDLWQSLRIVFRSLATGQPRLALPALGGLFAETQCPDLDSAGLTNRDLLAAMRQLRWSSPSGRLTAIDYRNMGPEELGSVYESLLELVPQLDLPARTFGFAGITDNASTSGNARKTSGSYYTPDSLVQELIKSALDPVIVDRLAAQPDRPVEALLSITVCDPSCGSGHFLLAAARRLAEKLAELRAPDGAVRPDDYRHALREVAGHCLYGVDINPMAVELCRVALWLETVDPGKPLGFLNHHIRTGNSLLGATPDLIAAGLPDDTFNAIEGDDKPACAELKKRNKKERAGFGPLFEKEEQAIRDRVRQAATAIEAMDDSQPTALQQKEAAFTTSETAPEYRHAKLLADLWCAAFVIKKTYPPSDDTESAQSPICDLPSPIEGHLLHTQDELFGQSTPASAPAKKAKQPRTKNQEQGTPSGITTAHLRDFVQGKALPADLQTEVEELARQYRFFHWHLAFPQVFDQGGFDCILGNPPWERVKLQEKEWFSERMPAIAAAATSAARKQLIDALLSAEPQIYAEFQTASRQAEGEGHVIRNSNRYPLCGRGDINLFAIFAEANRQLINATGRAGCVLPTGIATDDTTKFFFQDLVSRNALASVFSFENEEYLFPGVHHAMKFCLFTMVGSRAPSEEAMFIFYARQVENIADTTRLFKLSASDMALLSPNTRTCPVFRHRADAELCLALYRRVPVLIRDDSGEGNPWLIEFSRMFDMSNDSGQFRTSTELLADGFQLIGNVFVGKQNRCVPLYEAKMVGDFDHRSAGVVINSSAVLRQGVPENFSEDDHRSATTFPQPRYWVSESSVAQAVGQRDISALMGFCNVTAATNERTMTAALLPVYGVGHSFPIIHIGESDQVKACLAAALNSFVFDYVGRQKMGGINYTYFILKQLPAHPPSTYSESCPWTPTPLALRDWVLPRVLELTYTAWDLEAFAVDCGWSGPPFRWDEERRFLLRCELDAAFFHLYLGSLSEWQQQPEALTRAFPTPRHAVPYIMDTFPIVKRKDEAKHGRYRTKDTILQIYDALAESIRTGVAYQTRLDPMPASFRVAHRPRLPQQDRVPLTQGRAYWLEFLVAVARLAGDELTLEQLWEAYLIVVSAADLATEAEAVLGDSAKAWIPSLAAEPTEPGIFADMLETLNANGQLTRTVIAGQIRLTLSADIPVQPDAWRIFDAAAALAIHHARPAAVKADTTAQKPSTRREAARYEALERMLA